MTFAQLIEPVLTMRPLGKEGAVALMEYLMSEEATEAQIGAALSALRIKSCDSAELEGFARVLRAKATPLEHPYEHLVDTCGTGGGIPSFNVSTAAAIVACAAGARVAKHGNRGLTSKCGSADVLEALGLRLQDSPDRLRAQLDRVGIVFMFAPSHHPAMRQVAKPRRELGFRTVFNQLGPLANPAGARRQLIGVYEADLIQAMGEALSNLGAERALVVHGDDGLDEISPCGPTEVARVTNGEVTLLKLTPEQFSVEAVSPSYLAPGETTQQNAEILEEAISDPNSPRAQVILPSAAAALWLAGVARDLPEGARISRDAIATGSARRKLDQMIEESNRA